MRRFTTACSAFAITSCAISCSARYHQERINLPPVVLWAWERSEDLSFIDTRSTGVAFLAGTGSIARNGSVVLRLRTQSLKLPAGAAVMPVLRIESSPGHGPVQTAPLLSGLQTMANLRGVRGVQIDFDARASERTFYRDLLASAHNSIAKPLAVTALASWCDGDRWLDWQPIAEAVPMFFRMGRGESREIAVKSRVCRASAGLSTDEKWPANRPRGIERVYVFCPHAWTEEEYTRAMQRIENWK